MRKLFFLSGMLLAFNVCAEIKMSKLFSDNMVLQRDMPVPVWGFASPGEKVVVKFKTQEKSATADADGKWILRLDPLPASAQAEKLTVAGKDDRKEFSDVLVGEVWLCSGQSNMEVSFREIPQEVEGVDNPQIRFVGGLYPIVPFPDDNSLNFPKNGWQLSSTKSLVGCSRAGYHFAFKLWQDIKVPVGIINAPRGCSSIEAWMPPESFSSNEKLKGNIAEMEEIQKISKEYEKYTNEEKEKIFMRHCSSKYGGFARGYMVNGKIDPEKYKPTLDHMFSVRPACLYSHAIRPVIPFAIRGVLWYQGETNVDDDQYALKQQALIESWRKLWNEGDFPFYTVQVAPYKSYSNLPNFWLQQYEAVKKVKNSGLASTVDITEIDNVHPKNKKDVGIRLALLALRDTYGKKDVVASGPTYKSMKVADGKIIVSFDNLGAGLTTKDGKSPDWFEVSGTDGHFVKATAEIKADTVEVSSPDVKNPKNIRFGWSCIGEPNLRNKEGLPAFPFNTAEPFFQRQ